MNKNKKIDFSKIADLFPEKGITTNKALGGVFAHLSLIACEDIEIAKMFIDVQKRIEKEGATEELNKSCQQLIDQIIYRFLRNNGMM